MNGRSLGLIIGCFLLLLLAAAQGHRLAQEWGDHQLDLGGRGMASLSPETHAFLTELDRRLSFTYFVSGRDRMPSHLQGVEAAVGDLLQAIRRQAPDQIDVRVLDPDLAGPAGAAYAATRKVSPINVRRILQDETSEETIWSSLVVAYGDYPAALIQGIQATDLPYLEEWLLAHLRAMRQPLRPTFALAAPASFRGLAAALAQHGAVLELDLTAGDELPLAADVLFWMQPEAVTAAHLSALRRFIDAGRTVVLAGSSYTVEYVLDAAGEIRFQARPLGDHWSTLLAELGLVARPDLLLDQTRDVVVVRAGEEDWRAVEAPFHLRCLPAFYNMKAFHGPARGALNFVAAAALETNPRRLRDAGFRAEVVATTTAGARITRLPRDQFGPDDLTDALPVPKQNLMVLLKPTDGWRGQVLVLGSPSLFEDGIFEQSRHAHRVFLQTLLRTFKAPERLVRQRLSRPAPERLPPLGPAARLGWRSLVVFLVPGVLIALGVGRALRDGLMPTPRGGLASSQRGSLVPARRRGGLPGWRIGVALLLVLLCTQTLADMSKIRLDLTPDRINTPAPLTREVLTGAAPDVRAELVITPRASLPVTLKSIEPRIIDYLDNAGIRYRITRPAALIDAALERLRARGIEPFPVQKIVGDSLVSREVWSGLRLNRGPRTTIIPRLDDRTSRHLEFLLVSAVRRLTDGSAPHVAIISDLPRLSPAEAFEEFQKSGLIPPSGTDVYSHLKRLLADYGYRVSHVDPKQPVMPADVDLLLWLQPRRDSSRSLTLLAEHLTGGGAAIVALQHFNIQQRQYRGAGFETVYWPQPQFQDLDRYLTLFGVEQVREVLMDRTQSHLDLETQINRTAVREYDPQQVALPFLIRAVGSGQRGESVITRNLGDLLFIWGNRFALDGERLAALGITAEPLIETTAEAWSFEWDGGWLPPEIFTPTDYLAGPQPLAVRLTGVFPPVSERTPGPEDRRSHVLAPAHAGQPSGELVLIGSSEMFKNDYLYEPAYTHDQLLLNAVAALTLDEETALLQTRHPAVRGFPFRTPAAKAAWRLVVLVTGPGCMLLYGLVRFRRRWQPVVRP